MAHTHPNRMALYAFQLEGLMCQNSCGTTIHTALLTLPFSHTSCVSHHHSLLLLTPLPSSLQIPSPADLAALSAAVIHDRYTKHLTTPSPEHLQLIMDEIESVGFDATPLTTLANLPPPATTPLPLPPTTPQTTSNLPSITMTIHGISCTNCVKKITATLVPDFAEQVAVNALNGRAVVYYTGGGAGLEERLTGALEGIGFGATVLKEGESADPAAGSREYRSYKNQFQICLLFTLPLIIIHYTTMYQHINLGSSDENMADMDHSRDTGLTPPGTGSYVTMFLLASPVFGIVATKFITKAWKSYPVMGMDMLISIGVSASYFYSTFALLFNIVSGTTTLIPTFETGSMLLTFVTMGKMMESKAKRNTMEVMENLLKLQPSTGVVVSFPDAGDYQTYTSSVVPQASIKVGDVLLLSPHTTAPCDGVVVHASPHVFMDESYLTGESFPVKKEKGGEVIGGTMVTSGTGFMEAESVGGETTLNKIVALVEDAQTNQAPIQLFADRITSYFTPTVLTLSLLTFITWIACTHSFLLAFMRAISVVVVACPCALGLATPTAVMVGSGVAASRGILIKGGDILESTAKIDAIVMDKTGTMTEGNITVSEFTMLNESRFSTGTLLSVGRELELCSTHPIARALVQYCERGGSEKVEVRSFEDVPGCGVSAVVVLGGGAEVSVRLGKESWTSPTRAGKTHPLPDFSSTTQGAATTSVYLALDGDLVGVFQLEDKVRQETAAVIGYFQNTLRAPVYMCTGDSSRAAASISESVGIPEERVNAECMPGDKAKLVERLQASGKNVMFIGDGVNDSVALVTANSGVGMGGGSEIAMDACDIVLMKNNLWDVAVAIDLSATTLRRIKINFCWAMVYNVCMLPVSAGVLYPFVGWVLPPAFAGLAMALSSVSVVGSSLMLKWYRWRGDDDVGSGIESKMTVGGWGEGGSASKKGATKRKDGHVFSLVGCDDSDNSDLSDNDDGDQIELVGNWAGGTSDSVA